MDNTRYVVTLSGKVRNFHMLHYAAALLECEMEWCTLVPLDESIYVNSNKVEESAEMVNGYDSLLLKIHKQKIDMSDGLYVYFDKNDLFEHYKTSDTLKELRYAMNNGLDIYFSNLPKDINDVYTYNDDLEYYIKPSMYNILSSGMYKVPNDEHEITHTTLNIIKIDYLEPKFYERAKQHGIIM